METIWLVNPYGPIEGENWRDYSFNQFGKYLSMNGYKVIWWTSNFAHHFKKYRSDSWKDIVVNENFIIRLVPTTSYKKNFSLGRFKKDIVFAKNAYSHFNVAEQPDMIISADNPLTMSYPSFKFAEKHKIPVIYDQMDLWPEFIENVAGRMPGKILNLLFTPVYRQRKKNYHQLSGVIALGKNYLSKAKEIAPSLEGKPQALIYNGIDVRRFREKLSNNIEIENLPKEKGKDEIWCVFAGTLGPSYDVETIIECARRLNSKDNSIRFIVAGSGPLEELVIKADQELGNFNFIGKLSPDDLVPVYGKCDIGLSTYTANSNVDMPDKFYDYTAAGLVVVNSLNGEIKDYIENYNVGVNYVPGDAKSLHGAISYYCNKQKLEEVKNNSLELGLNFDKEVQSRKLLEVIKRVLKEDK